ncbi:MAG: diaminopimelate decarboxylase [Lentisphaerae bacterium]|nr:diaminopimelate decarboxylase [Lentisphaerota bacterium]OQC15482.1 MAG: Diaminopimelate decarboxylase [Lentisphaerae bacterium ADurb.Bin082]HQL87042.1 diaminopimelate decarboxylase [Lentisphaeria bacterium]
MQIINGQIFLEEVPVTTLAATYGTPTYVYEENRIRANFRRALAAFRKYYDDFRFFYAIKANNNLAVANILRQEGAGIDAASVNEILLAQKLGLGGEDVMFSGNFLSDDDIRQGLESGVIFNLDDISLLPRVIKLGRPEFLSFRVNPGYGKSEVGDFVTNAGPGAKFGVHPDQVMDAYRLAKEAGVKRFGAHMMPGSCIRDPEYFRFITELLMDIIGHAARELDINFDFIDLGGGLGIPYKHEDHLLDIEKAASLVADVFQKKIAEYGLKPPRLMMEPARYFVGDAGYILGQVHAIKDSYSRIIGTDVSMNILARPAMYGSYHHIYVNGREDEPRTKVGLCGQVCENTDFWVRDRELPSGIALNDIIVVENAGAYGYAMSYQYNGRLKPAEVLVNGKQHWLIRERETIEDLVRNVTVPKHLQR